MTGPLVLRAGRGGLRWGESYEKVVVMERTVPGRVGAGRDAGGVGE